MHQSVLFILFLAFIQLTYSCYITNCPIGGKRSLGFNNDLHNHQVRKYLDNFHKSLFYFSVHVVELMVNVMVHQFVVQAVVAVLDIQQTFVNVQQKIEVSFHVLSKVQLVQLYLMVDVLQMVYAVVQVCNESSFGIIRKIFIF